MESSSLPAGVIFDMDGVLVDSNPFHLQKWAEFLNEHGIIFRSEELAKQVLGHRNDRAFRYFLGPQISEDRMRQLNEELEARFRRLFEPHAKPMPGVAELIGECHQTGIPMAVASSAPAENVEFVVEALGFTKFFSTLLAGEHVTHPKPDPEIYLKAAERLGVPPAECVAFEDSFVGAESAKGSGMKCVAIASTFPLEEWRRDGGADYIVSSLVELNLESIRRLFSP